MGKPNFLISLTTDENDYQQLQAADAEETAQELGVEVKIVFAKNNSVVQSTQLLQAIQSSVELRPTGIIVEPVGTGMIQVARAAVSAGIGWAILNREVNYIRDLRAEGVPSFVVTSDHERIGRIQGQQMEALLSSGGLALQVAGPVGDISRKRTQGMLSSKPANLQLKTIRGNWTEESAYHAAVSWLRLSIARELRPSLVAAQDDSMAMGTRRAIQDTLPAEECNRWLSYPFLGCDGLPSTGQEWVRSGLLAATVSIPSNTGPAIRIMTQAFRLGSRPPEHTMTVPVSYPPLAELSAAGHERHTPRGLSHASRNRA